MLEKHPDLQWPASLYLEGSDQHRGWFHSSLLESCGTRGRAPYDAVLTHGFVLDEQGRKMSKSLGNVVAPQKIVDKLGADILRLWVVSSDYSEDLRIGPEIIKYQGELYRRLRNTLRYLLGELAGFADAERVAAPTRCRSSSAGCCTAWANSTRCCADPSPTNADEISASTRSTRRCIISARSICRRSISTSARTRSTATARTRRAAAPRAPCSTTSSRA